MLRLLFLMFVVTTGSAQAAEVVLPAALPNNAVEDEPGTIPVPKVNRESKDIFQGTVLPKKVPVANSLFDFPQLVAMKEEKHAATPEQKWQEAMRDALISQNIGEDVQVDGVRYDHRFEDAKREPAIWRVENILAENKSYHFTGALVAEGKDPVKFRGHYSAMRKVPVLKNHLMKGETVSARDIEMRSVLVSRLGNKAITENSQIVGKHLNRAVAVGAPIYTYDLILPTAVSFNSEVEMIYHSDGIELTDRGIALEKGAVGEVIRVKNSKSGKMLRARIEGPNKVSVNYLNDRSSYASN